MFLDWLERRVDPFAPFDEARMPPRSILGFAWFYLRPIRAALAALFVIAVIAGTVEASLYLVMRWFIDLLGSADRATVLSDHAVELGLVVVLIAVVRPLSIWAHEVLSNQLIVPQSTSQIRWRAHLYTLGHALSYFQGTMGALASFQVTPDMLVAGGKALIQAQLGKLKDSMADSFVRSVSAGAFDAMVKSSLFGYSESLEREADAFALDALSQRFGNVQAFERVAQRLLDEAQADEKKFSAFYANEERLARRVQAAQAHAAEHPVAAVPLAPTAPAEPTTAQPVAEPSASQAYLQALAPLTLRVLETELELGRLGRTLRNIERPRAQAPLPPQAKAVLAEACVARADAASTDKGEALARALLAERPDDARMLKLLGLQALKRGQAADARQWLQQARDHAASDDERGFIEQYLRRAEKIAAAPQTP